MTRTISLPEDLLKKAEELAAIERMSVEEFLSTQLAEQFAGLEYLKAASGTAPAMKKFRAALRPHVPDVEPEEHDRF